MSSGFWSVVSIANDDFSVLRTIDLACCPSKQVSYGAFHKPLVVCFLRKEDGDESEATVMQKKKCWPQLKTMCCAQQRFLGNCYLAQYR